VVNKKNDFSLSTKDIDGAQVGSIQSKALFIDVGILIGRKENPLGITCK